MENMFGGRRQYPPRAILNESFELARSPADVALKHFHGMPLGIEQFLQPPLLHGIEDARQDLDLAERRVGVQGDQRAGDWAAGIDELVIAAQPASATPRLSHRRGARPFSATPNACSCEC